MQCKYLPNIGIWVNTGRNGSAQAVTTIRYASRSEISPPKNVKPWIATKPPQDRKGSRPPAESLYFLILELSEIGCWTYLTTLHRRTVQHRIGILIVEGVLKSNVISFFIVTWRSATFPIVLPQRTVPLGKGI